MTPNTQSSIPVVLEPAPSPVKPPQFICGAALDVKQAAELLKILRVNKFFALPNNRPLSEAVFLHVQADVNNGGVISIGYNTPEAN